MQYDRQQAHNILRTAGIADPSRLVRLIESTIASLRLDLRGLTVLTEAASGPYVVTPVIAALAGAARVWAITRTSRYAAAEEVLAQTRALEQLCAPLGTIEIATDRRMDFYAAADIVTNLGFVRPLDAQVVAVMKPDAVVPLMCEAWEYRPDDVDLDACQARGIRVAGTNEDFPGLEVFAYSGWLCQKMLFDAQIEVHKSKIVVVSSDKFGLVIRRHLSASGIEAQLLPNLRGGVDLTGIDAIVIADYTRADLIIGADGDMTASEVARQAWGATIIQFAGHIAVDELRAVGVAVSPGAPLGPHRMAVTLAGLGPRPVVELHTAGLKVGEMLAKSRSLEFDDEQLSFGALMQPMI